MRTTSILLFLVAFGSMDAAPRLGLQSWTLRNYSFDQLIEFASRHEITHVQLFRAHVDPMDSEDVNREKLRRLQEAGIIPYSIYDSGDRDLEDNRPLFELAKMYGMRFVVVEPKNQGRWHELLRLSREYGILLAVHNHGSGTTYGNPGDVMKVLKNHGDRVGVCLDVGWLTSAGFDAETIFLTYGANRVFDIHFKDKRVEKGESGTVVQDVLPGEGSVNFPGLFRAIADSKWSGVMAIETDSQAFAENPTEIVGPSISFFRKFTDAP